MIKFFKVVELWKCHFTKGSIRFYCYGAIPMGIFSNSSSITCMYSALRYLQRTGMIQGSQINTVRHNGIMWVESLLGRILSELSKSQPAGNVVTKDGSILCSSLQPI